MSSPTNKNLRNSGGGTNGNLNEKGPRGIDRETKCPLLLRVFCATSRHNSISDYNKGKVPTNELQIYTWKDASLKELTSLVREVNTESRRKGTFFDFALIYPSPSSRGNFQRQTNQFMDYISKEIGTTVSGRKGVDDSKTLQQCGFVIGDYLDISITPPGSASRGMMSLDRMAGDRDHRGLGGGRHDRRGPGGGPMRPRDGRDDRRRPY